MKTAIEMAREVGSPAPKSLCGRTDYLVITPDELERFAEFVRADERAECAKVADGFIGCDAIVHKIRARSNT